MQLDAEYWEYDVDFVEEPVLRESIVSRVFVWGDTLQQLNDNIQNCVEVLERVEAFQQVQFHVNWLSQGYFEDWRPDALIHFGPLFEPGLKDEDGSEIFPWSQTIFAFWDPTKPEQIPYYITDPMDPGALP